MISEYIISRVLLGETPRDVLTWLIEQEVSPEVLQSFRIKDELNPVIWSKGRMRDDVRSRLMKVANSFIGTLDLDDSVEVSDVTLTGSIANYNWSDFSDVDLHVRIKFDEVDENEKLVRNYFLAKKSLWNEKYKLDIGGIPIELYVENVGDTHVASGLYSVLTNKWLVKPKKRTLQVDLDDVKTKADGFMSFLTLMRNLVKSGEYDRALSLESQVKDNLKRLRQAGLETGGEFSVENLAFKSLRRSGYIKAIDDLATEAQELKSMDVAKY